MYNHIRYTNSKLSRSIWLALAVFFIVFSSPVRKYIRMQLYKQVLLVESVENHVGKRDIKDCTIADKPEQSPISTFFFTAHAPGGGGDTPDLTPFFLPALVCFAFLLLLKNSEKVLVTSTYSLGAVGSPLPLFLRIRHLRI